MSSRIIASKKSQRNFSNNTWIFFSSTLLREFLEHLHLEMYGRISAIITGLSSKWIIGEIHEGIQWFIHGGQSEKSAWSPEKCWVITRARAHELIVESSNFIKKFFEFLEKRSKELLKILFYEIREVITREIYQIKYRRNPWTSFFGRNP